MCSVECGIVGWCHWCIVENDGRAFGKLRVTSTPVQDSVLGGHWWVWPGPNAFSEIESPRGHPQMYNQMTHDLVENDDSSLAFATFWKCTFGVCAGGASSVLWFAWSQWGSRGRSWDVGPRPKNTAWSRGSKTSNHSPFLWMFSGVVIDLGGPLFEPQTLVHGTHEDRTVDSAPSLTQNDNFQNVFRFNTKTHLFTCQATSSQYKITHSPH